MSFQVEDIDVGDGFSEFFGLEKADAWDKANKQAVIELQRVLIDLSVMFSDPNIKTFMDGDLTKKDVERTNRALQRYATNAPDDLRSGGLKLDGVRQRIGEITSILRQAVNAHKASRTQATAAAKAEAKLDTIQRQREERAAAAATRTVMVAPKKKSKLPIILAAGGGVLLLGGIAFALTRRKRVIAPAM